MKWSSTRTLVAGSILLLLVALSTPAGAAMLPQWTASYNGVDNKEERAYDITTDSSGNIYITGQTADDTEYYDLFVAKYDPDGTLVWDEIWSGANGTNDWGYSIAVDEDGNVYVAGYTDGGTTGADALLVKFTATGALDWDKVFDSGNLADYFYQIALDDDGHVYAAGRGSTLTTGANFFVVKYETDGTYVWDILHSGAVIGGEDELSGMAVDGDGNVYLSGTIEVIESADVIYRHDVALVKYNADGDFQWERLVSGDGAGSNDYGDGVAVGATGVFFAGMFVMDHTVDNVDLGFCHTLADNSEYWRATYNGPGDDLDMLPQYSARIGLAGLNATGVATGPDGKGYMLGSLYNGFTGGYDLIVHKYAENGSWVWTATYSAGDNTRQYPIGLAVDEEGNVFVTAIEHHISGNTNNYLTIMIDSDGTVVDHQIFNGPGNGNDYAEAVAIDPDGNPVVTGIGYQGVSEDYNAYTIKYCVGCLIDDVCRVEGEVDPDNPCLVCDPTESQTDWSDNDGASCEDDLYCNGADTCGAGTCSVHTGDPCNDDGLWCNGEESCDETNDECVSEYVGEENQRCPDDLTFCNGEESCDETNDECVSSGDPCEDNQICNEDLDQCDEVVDDDTVDDDVADDDVSDDDLTDDDSDDDVAPTDDDTSGGSGGDDDDDDSGCGC